MTHIHFAQKAWSTASAVCFAGPRCAQRRDEAPTAMDAIVTVDLEC